MRSVAPAGGKREGAGRPKKAPAEGRVNVIFTCPPALAKAIDARAVELGFKGRSAYLQALVKGELAGDWQVSPPTD